MLVRPTFGPFKISTLGGGEGEIKPMLCFFMRTRGLETKAAEVMMPRIVLTQSI